MPTLIERNIARIERRLVLLAPSPAAGRGRFVSLARDGGRHRTLLRAVQRLRGEVYVTDGAIDPAQLDSGLHCTPEDQHSWHLIVTEGETPVACAWYREHDSHDLSVHDLRVRTCPLSKDPSWGPVLHRAIQRELTRAREARLPYAELGGWAVSAANRCTSNTLLLSLAVHALSHTLGGALGMTSATVRHASSAMLRRMGGESFEENGTVIPSYFDPRYGCQMELLRFDSRTACPQYRRLLDLVQRRFVRVPVYAPSLADTYAAALPATAPASAPALPLRSGPWRGVPAATRVPAASWMTPAR